VKHRLCLPELAGSGTEPGRQIDLSREQAHYLGRVLRLAQETEIGLFDGAGTEWCARLTAIDGRRASARLIREERTEPHPKPLVLVQSWLKGSAMDAVVQKSVELGATALWLMDADRSNVRTDARRRAGKLAHLERVARSAAEQCETLWLPELTCRGRLAEVLDLARPGRTLFFDLSSPPLATAAPEPLTLLIGPEGGWSEAERALARETEDVEVVGLGPLTLRAETAPLAVLSAVRQSWGWRR
jgi:16S rRNA (uracil1498-N3)-methyltransferase